MAAALDQLPRHSRFVIEGTRSYLLNHSGKVFADFLILGAHGWTGIGHALLGSVAEDVLQRAGCDLLVEKAW